MSSLVVVQLGVLMVLEKPMELGVLKASAEGTEYLGFQVELVNSSLTLE